MQDTKLHIFILVGVFFLTVSVDRTERNAGKPVKYDLKKAKANYVNFDCQAKVIPETKPGQVTTQTTTEGSIQESRVQKLKIARQNQLLLALIIGFILIAVTGVLFYLQWKHKEENKRLLIQEQLFRSQMNPHFIFNALNAIKNFILINKKAQAADYLVDFSTLMRLILEGSAKDFTMLNKEIELLKNYLNLQQLRFNKTFHYEIYIDEKLDPSEVVFPSMLLQPFVENAVEHGVNKGGSLVEITFKQQNKKNVIESTIRDNGPGFNNSLNPSDENEKPSALQITKERLKVLKNLYKWNIDLYINNLKDNNTGTHILLKMPKCTLEYE
jgi:sensor histidine kinase YesM